MGGRFLWDGVLNYFELKREHKPSIHLSQFPDSGCNVTCCLRLPTPWPPYLDGLHPQTVSQNNPSLLLDVCSALGGQKRLSDLLELELKMAISHLVGTGTQTQALLEEQLMLVTTEPSLQPQVPNIVSLKLSRFSQVGLLAAPPPGVGSRNGVLYENKQSTLS